MTTYKIEITSDQLMTICGCLRNDIANNYRDRHIGSESGKNLAKTFVREETDALRQLRAQTWKRK